MFLGHCKFYIFLTIVTHETLHVTVACAIKLPSMILLMEVSNEANLLPRKPLLPTASAISTFNDIPFPLGNLRQLLDNATLREVTGVARGECSRIDDELIDNSSREVGSPRTFGNCRKRYGEPVELFGRMSERGMKMMDGEDEKDEGCYQCVADTRSDQKNDVSVRAKTMF